MRKRLYEIIETDSDDILSNLYDLFMIAVIVLSLIPLMVKRTDPAFAVIDIGCASVFAVDYILRFMTADYKLKDSKHPFLLYPFTFMAIVDLLSILPLLTGFHILRAFRLFRMVQLFRVFRVFKAMRYSKSIDIIVKVIRDTKDALIAVLTFSAGYVFVTALIMFNVEPKTFGTFLDALYWATVSLATIGYGDIAPVSDLGKVITIISAFLGITVIALPAGIITAGYMEEIWKLHEKEKKDDGSEEERSE